MTYNRTRNPTHPQSRQIVFVSLTESGVMRKSQGTWNLRWPMSVGRAMNNVSWLWKEEKAFHRIEWSDHAGVELSKIWL